MDIRDCTCGLASVAKHLLRPDSKHYRSCGVFATNALTVQTDVEKPKPSHFEKEKKARKG